MRIKTLNALAALFDFFVVPACCVSVLAVVLFAALSPMTATMSAVIDWAAALSNSIFWSVVIRTTWKIARMRGMTPNETKMRHRGETARDVQSTARDGSERLPPSQG